MAIKEIVAGRKTFFVTPDVSLFPDDFLEEYFVLGYECYFVDNDKHIDLEKKLDVIVQLFKDVIIFFNIDFEIPGIVWSTFIKKFSNKYDNQIPIGVLYTKRQSKEDKTRIERYYLFDLGLKCGCIQLEYQKKMNLSLIERVLFANQSQGRRKNIRAICPNSCIFNFNFKDTTYNGSLRDISLSHFSFSFPEGKLSIQLYEKISEVHINFRGFHFKSDAVLLMERPSGDGDILYVFSFVSGTGANGLDERIRQLLIPNLYQLLMINCKSLIDGVIKRITEKRQSNQMQNGIPDEIIPEIGD